MKKLANGVSNIDVRKINLENTLRCVLRCEHISQPELAQQLGVSWPTVLQNIKKLLELGLVQEIGAYASTGGRKPRAFAANANAHFAVGVEISKNDISLVLVNILGELVQYTRKTCPYSSTDAYYEAIARDIGALLLQADITSDKVLGVGVALPGIVSEDGGTLVHSHVLEQYSMNTEVFSRHIPYSCIFINDANAAGFAELSAQNEGRNAVYLSLSNTVGGAIFMNGHLYTGDNLRAGEFGHNTLVPNGKPCYCGKNGCVDAYCSALILSQASNGSLPLFFQKLRDNGSSLMALWQEYTSLLAIAVNNLRMSYDCDVILGGYVGGFLEEHLTDFRQKLISYNTFETNAAYLKPCRYKLEAAAIGAALVQIEAFIQSL